MKSKNTKINKSYSVRKRIAKEKADSSFSKFIRKRDNGICVICGSKYKVQCGHLIKRGKMATRFDELNCHAQCSKCNYLHNYEPDHYIGWFIQEFGGDMYLELYEESKKTVKMTLLDFEKIDKQYKNLLIAMETKGLEYNIDDLPF